MRRVLLSSVLLIVSLAGPARAETFTVSSAGLSAGADFQITGGSLTITLTNLSDQRSGWTNGDLLAALFFDISGNPSLTFESAEIGTGSRLVTTSNVALSAPASIMAPPDGGLIGGWGFSGAAAGHGDVTQRYGLGTSGFDGIWNGLNVGGGGKNGKPGNYALVGNVFTDGNRGLDGPLIASVAVFTLSGIDPNALVSNVRFQYGSDFEGTSLTGDCTTASGAPCNSIVNPEPASMLLLGTGLLGAAMALRRRSR